MKNNINYSQLFEEMNIALYIIRDGKIIDCNRRAIEQSGGERVDIIGKEFLEKIQLKETEGNTLRDTITKKISEAQNYNGQIFEATQISADGRIFDVEINLTYMKPFLVASVQEISERKERDRLLEGSAELYKKIIEESLSTSYVIQDGKIAYTNEKRYLEINRKYGQWINGIIGKEAVSLVHPDDREMLREQVTNILKGKRTAPYHYRLAMKDKEKNVWMMGTVSSILYKGKRAMLAHAIDVTELKESIHKVQELKTLESSLLAAMPQAVFGILQRRIIFVNKTVETMFGWSTQDLIGESVRIIYRNDEEFNQGGEITCEAMKSGKKYVSSMELPFPLKRKDGSEIMCRVTGSAVGSYTDDQRSVVIIEDITEKKMAQFQLLQSEKMASIGQLAVGVAHEINNPISFVSSNLKTLSEYLNDIVRLLKLTRSLPEAIEKENMIGSGTLHKRLDEIKNLESEMKIDFIIKDLDTLIKESQEGTDRIIRIVRDLKTFAHPGDENIKIADINENIESTLNIVWNELKYKAVVRKEYGNIPKIYCHPQQLNQVFMNILVNASQAIKEKGEIIIFTGNDHDGNIEIRIQDNGIGIPEENISKLFNPFFTTKEVGKGTGLGLHVAYNIIQKHQGKIEVESKVGVGTTFIIRLPIKNENQQ